VHYVITGGGGAPLYDVDKPPTGITQKVISALQVIENVLKEKRFQIMPEPDAANAPGGRNQCPPAEPFGEFSLQAALFL
jgi:hypothetical protein